MLIIQKKIWMKVVVIELEEKNIKTPSHNGRYPSLVFKWRLPEYEVGVTSTSARRLVSRRNYKKSHTHISIYIARFMFVVTK
jgi:hypothetical protein